MDLFDSVRQAEKEKNAPLAKRMTPRTLEEYVGQEHILAPDKMLHRTILSDRLSSLILYGPPGTGKTALARIIAAQTSASFETLNAVSSGIKDIKEVVKKASDDLGLYGQKTILFIDEIHRFNKSQQDALLPHVEEGLLTLIGATTENPYVEVNRALLSRSTIYQLRALRPKDLEKILRRALEDEERGFGRLEVSLDPKALDHLVLTADGDARTALNALELAVLTTPPAKDSVIRIDKKVAEESIQQKTLSYDKKGDNHYDVVSAFIKSMRASKVDASLHYLIRMLEAGEDPRFVCRRMMIFASEDIGMADPQALLIATSADYALKNLGMPEAYYPMTQACIYLAQARKSNECKKALGRARKDVLKKDIGQVPFFLRDQTFPRGEAEEGEEAAYIYPPQAAYKTDQIYLPKPLEKARYYQADNLEDLSERKE